MEPIRATRIFWDTPTLQTAERAMSHASARHRALAHNLANANTPNYQRVDVPLPTPPAENRAVQLARQHAIIPMRASDPRHYTAPPEPRWRNALDGNTVDPEREMALLAENELRYAMLVRIAGGQVRTLLTAITGGQNR
jgi:flagellar basal-body rod protein FlgB